MSINENKENELKDTINVLGVKINSPKEYHDKYMDNSGENNSCTLILEFTAVIKGLFYHALINVHSSTIVQFNINQLPNQ